jgi:hypothetical protein
VTAAQQAVVAVCLLNVSVLAVWGAYWLGGRNAMRTFVSAQLDHAIDAMTAVDEDDGDEGIRVSEPSLTL